MARVTVEDCIMNVPNRFELVVVAANRAKQIASGSELTLDRDNDKDAVVSLREIAEKTIDLGQVQEDIVQSFRKKQVIENFKRPTSASAEVQEMLAEEGAQVEDQAAVAEQLSVATPTKSGGLSFETDNVEVED